jgi:hypothetical protein
MTASECPSDDDLIVLLCSGTDGHWLNLGHSDRTRRTDDRERTTAAGEAPSGERSQIAGGPAIQFGPAPSCSIRPARSKTSR